jgi:SAM-dependent methyltransferase
MKLMSTVYSNARSARMFLRTAPKRWQLRGTDVECIVCGYQGRQFADGNWHERTTCPKCLTETRHRLLLGSMKLLPEWSSERLIVGKRVLHFAPEPVIRHFIRSKAAKYVSADFMHRDANLRLDISNMSSVGDAAFDCCIVCDVLEHVPDDLAALRELYRILSPGGVAIITIPQQDHAAKTYEDWSITTPEARLAAFGQRDHVRVYGSDVVERMAAAGFRVATIDAGAFEADDVTRFVLRPPVLSARPLATNFRKVFFCCKDG